MAPAKKTVRPKPLRIDGAVKQALEISRGRILFVTIMVALSYAVIILRLLDLSIANAQEQASKHIAVLGTTDIQLQRGTIVDRNGILLATNLKTFSLYANPRKIMDVQEAVDGILKVIPTLDRKILVRRLSGDKMFIWLKHHLHPSEVEAINNLGLPGLNFQEEEKRTYPHGHMLAHVIGMVGMEGYGLSGIEKEFNNYLSDPDNEPLQLSLDLRIQSILHQELMEKYMEHKAKGAAGIVMDVNNGEILAMVSLPDFDPNNPKKIDPKSTFNHVTTAVYEMGSTFKTFNHALALDLGVATMKGSYDARKPIKIGRFRIRDHHAQNRVLSVPEVYMYSSNIGSAKMADEIGPVRQREFFDRLGLTRGIDLEIPETSQPLVQDKLSRISTMTMSFGHGIAVSPLHVAAGISSIINGGMYRNPTLLKGYGEEGERVIKEQTSRNMRKLMRMVVGEKEGTGKKAAAEGYRVGGKTGTAEKAIDKRYNRKQMVTSFVGVFPMDDPKYLVMAVMDEPQPTKKTFGFATAGWTAAPVIKAVVEKAAPVLGIKPVDEASEKMQKLFHVDYPRKQQNHYATR